MGEPDRQRHVLVLGRGLLGPQITALLRLRGYAVDNIGRAASSRTNDYWDLLDPSTFRLSSQYSHAVVAAGMTSFASCERNEARSFSINAAGRSAVVRELLDRGCHVTLLSSDAVYSGRNRVESVHQAPDAQSVYGKHLAYAEEKVIGFGSRAAVLRLGKVMHPQLPILRDWAAKLARGASVRAFSDSACAPVSLQFASDAVAYVIANDISGRVNATGDVDMTWFEVAQLVARTMNVPLGRVQEDSCADSLGNEVCRRFSALPPTHRLPVEAPRGTSAVMLAVRSIMHASDL